MESDFEKKLHLVKPKGLTKDEKSMLWSNIENSVEAEGFIKAHKKVAGPFNIFANIRRIRYVVAAVLTGTLLAGSFGTVALADNSRPGDFLFPVELASENLRLKLTSPDNRDELQIQFASERLEEVKELLALAGISFEELESANIVTEASSTATSTDGDTATTTDNTGTADDDTSTTTNETDEANNADSSTTNGEESDDTSSQESNVDEEKETAYDESAITRASNAFLVALHYLEDSRADLVASGNDSAIIIMDAFIEELTVLASNHVDDIEGSRIVVNTNGNKSDKVSIAIKASIDNVKTEFKYTETADKKGETTKQKIVLNNGDDQLKLNIDNEDSKRGYDDDDDDRHFTVCYKGKNIELHYNELTKYLKKGAKLDDCEDKDDDHDDDHDGDDDDDDDKKYYVCHKGQTLHVAKASKKGHLGHGDTYGKCYDDYKDDDDDDKVTVPDCSLSGDYVYDFNGKMVRSDKSESDSYTDHRQANLPGGTYKVTLMSYDGYEGREEKTQPKESWEIVFWDKSENAFQRTSAVSDIDDYVREDTVIEVVDEEFVYNGDADELYAQHSAYPDTSSANSVKVICAAFNKVSDDDGRDHDAPQITNIEATENLISASVSWATDENATGKVWFSEDGAFEPGTSVDFVSSGSLKTNHLLTINGLTPETKYYYIVESSDASGNKAKSSRMNFTTLEDADTTAPIITGVAVNPTTTEATVAWITDENTTGTVWFSTASPIDIEGIADAKKSTTLKKSHSTTLESLSPETAYYYLVVAEDAEGNVSTSTEDSFETTALPVEVDETAPVVSGLNVEATTTEATLTFNTNEDAVSTILYGIVGGALDMDSVDSTLKSSHSHTLSGLADDTEYSYQIVTTDGSGNTSTSTEDSFMTTEIPVPVDETGPVVSNLSTEVGSTTLDVSFNTNEDATSKMYYSDISPVNLGSASFEENVSLSSAHGFSLSGLATSTTYYFVLTAKDESDNETIETEDSFTTL